MRTIDEIDRFFTSVRELGRRRRRADLVRKLRGVLEWVEKEQGSP